MCERTNELSVVDGHYLLDGELLVCLDLDLTRLFKGFLLDEGDLQDNWRHRARMSEGAVTR